MLRWFVAKCLSEYIYITQDLVKMKFWLPRISLYALIYMVPYILWIWCVQFVKNRFWKICNCEQKIKDPSNFETLHFLVSASIFRNHEFWTCDHFWSEKFTQHFNFDLKSRVLNVKYFKFRIQCPSICHYVVIQICNSNRPCVLQIELACNHLAQ